MSIRLRGPSPVRRAVRESAPGHHERRFRRNVFGFDTELFNDNVGDFLKSSSSVIV